MPPLSSSDKRREFCKFLIAISTLNASTGYAQLNSETNRRLIVPSQPGGGVDSVARLIAQNAEDYATRPWIILNRHGASGNLGRALTAKAKPDGNTLLLTGSSYLFAKFILPKTEVDSDNDLQPLVRIGTVPNVLMLHESLKNKSVSEKSIIQTITNLPLFYGSSGYGTSSHVTAERFKKVTGANWHHAPYNSTAPALHALMSGEVQVMFVPMSSVHTVINSGRAFPVAVSHHARVNSLKQIPTLRELGIVDADYFQWYGVFMPKGASDKTLIEIEKLLKKIVTSQKFTDGLDSLTIDHGFQNRTDFEKFLKIESKKIESIIKDTSLDRPVS